jgi:hypothetical protein
MFRVCRLRRLAREFGKRFGDNATTPSRNSSQNSLPPSGAQNSLSRDGCSRNNIANWAAVLRADSKAIWTVRATEAVQFLHQAAGFVTTSEEVAAA